MKTEPKLTHTPTPWGYVYDGSSEWSIGPANDPQSNPVMTIWSRDDNKAQANADFIVRAVNAHEELLEFVRYVCTYTEGDQDVKGADLAEVALHNFAERTLAKAEGK